MNEKFRKEDHWMRKTQDIIKLVMKEGYSLKRAENMAEDWFTANDIPIKQQPKLREKILKLMSGVKVNKWLNEELCLNGDPEPEMVAIVDQLPKWGCKRRYVFEKWCPNTIFYLPSALRILNSRKVIHCWEVADSAERVYPREFEGMEKYIPNKELGEKAVSNLARAEEFYIPSRILSDKRITTMWGKDFTVKSAKWLRIKGDSMEFVRNYSLQWMIVTISYEVKNKDTDDYSEKTKEVLFGSFTEKVSGKVYPAARFPFMSIQEAEQALKEKYGKLRNFKIDYSKIKIKKGPS